MREGQTATFGGFECEFVAVNHSIPDALAVAVHTAAGTVLHTGDFKMDQLPLDGRITDLRAFARLGESGVDLFMVDSTNAEVPGFVAQERGIGPVLDQVFADSTKRIIVASFASHVHRVQQVLDAAYTHDRRVALVGRSMVRNMGIAADLGYLKVPEGVLIDLKQVDTLRDDEIVLMCTGSQGEPMAALSRIANNDHKVSVGPGDTVIMASSLIPGNENAVFRVINGLTRLGARVVHSGNAKVHVSGHASAGELLYCYNILKPRNVMPVHGEIRHLVANAALAVQTGIPADRVVLAEDGVVVDLIDGRARIVGAVPCGYVYVDGSSVGEITEVELKDRRILGDEGFISIFAVVSSADGKVLAGPQIHARGFAEQDAVFDDILPELTAALEESARNGNSDAHVAPAGHAPRRRPLGVQPPAPPADDHPGGRRGLTAVARPLGPVLPAGRGRRSSGRRDPDLVGGRDVLGGRRASSASRVRRRGGRRRQVGVAGDLVGGDDLVGDRRPARGRREAAAEPTRISAVAASTAIVIASSSTRAPSATATTGLR